MTLLRTSWLVRWIANIIGWCALAGSLFGAGTSTATATATPVNGFIVAVVINSPGAGYMTAPEVIISGGGGNGARATATITAGEVSAITVLDAGIGYVTAPSVVIAPPYSPKLPAVQAINLIPMLSLRGHPGTAYELQYAEQLNGKTHWVTITNIYFSANSISNVFIDTNAPLSPRRFYRLKTLEIPENPNPENLVWLPAGVVLMGSPATEADRLNAEGPQTEVVLTQGFWMGKFEVTQAEYFLVTGLNPSSHRGDSSLPVERVTWIDATNYCARLTDRESGAGRLPAGYVYRLPTEAEWEYASRAGTSTRFSFGDDPGYQLLLQYGWFNVNSSNSTHRGGGKLPNAWGLYDMQGNVFEWCYDWMGTYPGGRVYDYAGPESGSGRILRGSSAFYFAPFCRSAARGQNGPTQTVYDEGFRVVLGRPIR